MKGKKQVKKIITFKTSKKDCMLDISTKLRPERYKLVKQIINSANCLKVFVFIIGGIIRLIISTP
jgi:hypothetical protein